MKKYMVTQIVRHSVTSPINIDSNAFLSPSRVRHQDQTSVCQCDLCREGEELEAATAAALTLLAERETNGVRTLPDNSNAATGQAEAEAVTWEAEKNRIPSFSSP